MYLMVCGDANSSNLDDDVLSTKPKGKKVGSGHGSSHSFLIESKHLSFNTFITRNAIH